MFPRNSGPLARRFLSHHPREYALSARIRRVNLGVYLGSGRVYSFHPFGASNWPGPSCPVFRPFFLLNNKNDADPFLPMATGHLRCVPELSGLGLASGLPCALRRPMAENPRAFLWAVPVAGSVRLLGLKEGQLLHEFLVVLFSFGSELTFSPFRSRSLFVAGLPCLFLGPWANEILLWTDEVMHHLISPGAIILL